jgi:type I restriction enzyme S subunit
MNPVQQVLTDHIGLWTGADTEKKSGRGRASGSAGTVYGIEKLRELILELVMRGKLVPQDPSDEPASALLERIQVEKARLVLDGKIKKDKPMAAIADDEKPFALPDTWEWARLGSIGYTQTGATPSKVNTGSFGLDVAFIKPGDIYSNYVDYANEGLSFYGVEQLGRVALAGSLLMVCIGTIGKCNLIERDCSFNQQINSVTPYLFDSNYLLSVFRSIYFYNEAWSRSSSTTIAILNKGNWETICIPVPPLDEQHRIVAKVDELMALCDRLEAGHTDAADAHEKLISHLLATLTGSQDSADFSAGWQRIAAHFDMLFTTEASIDALKQTLLQLAVMGKLVPQDPDDEPASALLERIQAEKAKLVFEGKIRKDKPLAAITDDEKPFESPQGWAWARFPELGEFGRGKSKHRPRNDPKLFNPGIHPLVQTGEVARANNIINEYHSKYSDIGLAQSKIWPVGTLCITIAANIADSALLGFDACFPDSVVGFVPCKPLKTSYFLYFMKTARQNLLKFAPATAQKNINLEILESILIPIPPLKEIFRIVAKIDELMALCDRMKTRIADAGALQRKLADAMVAQAVA